MSRGVKQAFHNVRGAVDYVLGSSLQQHALCLGGFSAMAHGTAPALDQRICGQATLDPSARISAVATVEVCRRQVFVPVPEIDLPLADRSLSLTTSVGEQIGVTANDISAGALGGFGATALAYCGGERLQQYGVEQLRYRVSRSTDGELDDAGGDITALTPSSEFVARGLHLLGSGFAFVGAYLTYWSGWRMATDMVTSDMHFPFGYGTSQQLQVTSDLHPRDPCGGQGDGTLWLNITASGSVSGAIRSVGEVHDSSLLNLEALSIATGPLLNVVGNALRYKALSIAERNRCIREHQARAAAEAPTLPATPEESGVLPLERGSINHV